MSYDIYLCDPVTEKVLELDKVHYMRGGTYAIGGTTEMWLNITYNYASVYYREDVLGKDGIRCIYELTGADSIPLLEKAISVLSDDVDENYWNCTEGNAKRALKQLLALSKMRPDGIWKGD